MLRSQIETIIDDTLAVMARHGYALPPFAHWSPQEWRAKAAQTTAMRGNFVGWNVAEFEEGAFEKSGIALITTRMGDYRDLDTGRGRLYGEKAFVLLANQYVPYHYHVMKTEDVVNRGGATLAIELVRVGTDGRPTQDAVTYERDGVSVTEPAHAIVRLQPGESIVLTPYVAHAFWAEGGSVLCGEVSLANDEANDNLFLSKLPAPAPIVEDVPARRLVVSDYAAL